jgi:hypothetical protein
MTSQLISRIKFRYSKYYNKKSTRKVRKNALKMASNWEHEYPAGTSRQYIADQIVECWERQSGEEEV